MLAVLIDPYRKSIELVENSGEAEAINTALDGRWGGGTHMVRRGHGQLEYGYCDDEGYYRLNQCYFAFANYPYPIGGKMIVYGLNGPNNVSTALTVAEVEAMTEWVDDIEFDRIEVVEENKDGINHQTWIPHFKRKAKADVK
jgi:hypothetical protein